MFRRIETMKEETQIGDEFVLKGESEKGSPICYIKAYVCTAKIDMERSVH